jgi:hypothetical protein
MLDLEETNQLKSVLKIYTKGYFDFARVYPGERTPWGISRSYNHTMAIRKLV